MTDREKIEQILDRFNFQRGYPSGDTKTRDSYVDEILALFKDNSTLEVSKLENDIRKLLNCESEENKSNTPDWVLASYLRRCLDAFNNCINMRERYYGRELKSGVMPVNPQVCNQDKIMINKQNTQD